MANSRPFFSVSWIPVDGSAIGPFAPRDIKTFERLTVARKWAAKVAGFGHSEISIWRGRPGEERIA